jgi:hypothetical protein
MFMIITFVVVPVAIGHWPMLGNGVGIGGAGGAGTLHTSGVPMHMPPAIVVAGNIA